MKSRARPHRVADMLAQRERLTAKIGNPSGTLPEDLVKPVGFRTQTFQCARRRIASLDKSIEGYVLRMLVSPGPGRPRKNAEKKQKK